MLENLKEKMKTHIKKHGCGTHVQMAISEEKHNIRNDIKKSVELVKL